MLCHRLHQAEEEFQHNTTTAKSTYESTLINKYASSSDPAIYRYIRAITKSGTIPPTVYLDNTSASSDESKASLFNQYFYSIFTASYQEPDYVYSSPNSIQLDSLVFNKEEVYAALVQLDPNKATGIDKISPKVPSTVPALFTTHYAIYSTLVYQLVLFPLNEKFI